MNLRKLIIAASSLLIACFQAASLPSGYGKVKLGMDVDSVKSALKSDHQFGYRGDRDVSLSPSSHETVIETDPTIYAVYSFFERCWFQFSDEKLSVITLNLNEEMMDYHSVFEELCEKYGIPDEISPKKSVWKSDSVTLSLEKPLSLKYVDAKAFKQKKESATVRETAAERARDEFLKGL